MEATLQDKKDELVMSVKYLRLVEKMGLPKKKRLGAIFVVRVWSLVLDLSGWRRQQSRHK